jgi:hypothetical protein
MGFDLAKYGDDLKRAAREFPEPESQCQNRDHFNFPKTHGCVFRSVILVNFPLATTISGHDCK